MKASELIKEIEKLIDEHGDQDIDINFEGEYGGSADIRYLGICHINSDQIIFEIWGKDESE